MAPTACMQLHVVLKIGILVCFHCNVQLWLPASWVSVARGYALLAHKHVKAASSCLLMST